MIQKFWYFVIPASEPGIQNWMPDQVRHDMAMKHSLAINGCYFYFRFAIHEVMIQKFWYFVIPASEPGIQNWMPDQVRHGMPTKQKLMYDYLAIKEIFS